MSITTASGEALLQSNTRILIVGQNREEEMAIETDNLGLEDRKEEAKKMLGQIDDLERHYCSAETDVFDHKTRNAALQSGKFSPPSGTIFEAIFQELKRKEQEEKNTHSFSNVVPRLHASGARSIRGFAGSMMKRFQSEKTEEHGYDLGWPPVANTRNDVVAYLNWSLLALFMHGVVPCDYENVGKIQNLSETHDYALAFSLQKARVM